MPDQRIPFPITDPTVVNLTEPLHVVAPSPTFDHPATIPAALRGAVRARRWLDMYRQADDHGTSDDEALCDLLTDLRHLADHMDPNAFYTALDWSYQHYLAEVADSRKVETTTCEGCGATIVRGEDCPNYGFGEVHA